MVGFVCSGRHLRCIRWFSLLTMICLHESWFHRSIRINHPSITLPLDNTKKVFPFIWRTMSHNIVHSTKVFIHAIHNGCSCSKGPITSEQWVKLKKCVSKTDSVHSYRNEGEIFRMNPETSGEWTLKSTRSVDSISLLSCIRFKMNWVEIKLTLSEWIVHSLKRGCIKQVFYGLYQNHRPFDSIHFERVCIVCLSERRQSPYMYVFICRSMLSSFPYNIWVYFSSSQLTHTHIRMHAHTCI